MHTLRFLGTAVVGLALLVAACASGPTNGGTGSTSRVGGRSTSDARVRSFVGAQLPGGGGGRWLQPMAQTAPSVIYYQFAFPG